MFGRKPKKQDPVQDEQVVTPEPSLGGGLGGGAQAILELAHAAAQDGNEAQSVHLYLAAFDAALANGCPEDAYVEGLRRAWHTALDLDEDTLAEHIFEQLAPFSNAEDVQAHNDYVRSMATDMLSHMGFSSDDAGEIASMIAQEQSSTAKKLPGGKGMIAAVRPATPEEVRTLQEKEQGSELSGQDIPLYDNLIGFDHAIDAMRKRGIGMASNPDYQEFLSMLRKRHGVDRAPAYEALLITADSVEDANLFALSTAREMNVPCVRMTMEDTPQGMPMLSFACSPSFAKAMQRTGGNFPGEGVLVLEAINEWEVPDLAPDSAESPLAFLMQHGAAQAVQFIRSAVDNPEVTVMASCAKDATIDTFFTDLLDPLESFEIDLPTRDERGALWRYAAELHQSLRLQDRDELVSFSEGLSRAEILDAAKRAAEDAFSESIRKRAYVGVSRERLLETLASYHAVDSDAYAALEDAAVAAFRRDIATFELLDE